MSTRRALAFSFLDRNAGLVIHMASAIVIARLLTPADIGVYSIATVLIGFIVTFRDLGAGQYFVQKQHLSVDDTRAVWTVQLGLGLCLSAIIVGASVPVAHFYREPRIQTIMLVIAFNFAVTPFLAFPNAWLVREMRFGTLAMVRSSGAIATAIVAIGLAWAGIGPISLAWGNLAGTLAGIVAIWTFGNAKLPWRPKFTGVREVLSFGSKMTLYSIVQSVYRSLPEIFLGRLQGMTDTGLYSRARGLVGMFDELVMAAVGAVALPFFAKQKREGHALKESYLHATALVTVLGWSFLGSLAVLAYPTIRLLYGDQWDDAVDPARCLAIVGMFLVPPSVCTAPLLASGAISKMVRLVMLKTCVTAVLASVGAYFGLQALAVALIPGAAFSTSLWLVLAKRQLGFRWRDLLEKFGRSAVVAVATAGVPLATTLYLGWRSPDIVLTLAIAVPGGTACFLLACCAMRHPIWTEILNAVKNARTRSRV